MTQTLRRRRPAKNPTITVRAPRDLFDRLHAEAHAHEVSLNAYCTWKLHQIHDENPPATYAELEAKLGLDNPKNLTFSELPFDRVRAIFDYVWRTAYKAGQDSTAAGKGTQ